MALDYNEMSYFNQQVGLAAASFGVADEDVAEVGTALDKLFSYRCSAPTTVIPEHGPQLQSMCTSEDCPLAENATCALYENDGVGMEPKNATMPTTNTTSGSSGNSSMPSPMTPSSSSDIPLAAAAATVVVLPVSSVFALVAGLMLAVAAL